jgi:RNA polymerase subunit RPABC4/transcription elongation factor Spt4
MIERLRTPVAGEPWTCSRCGEVLEPQFAQCWNCGTPR